MKYNNLSKYLIQKINEAERSQASKDRFAKKPQGGNGWFGLITSFLSWNGFASSNDPVSDLLAKQMADAEKSAAERLDKLNKSKEEAYIAKLEAKFANKERQLTLVNDQKIRRHKAAKKRLETLKNQAKNSNTIRTPEQNEEFYAMLDKEYREGEGLPDNAQYIQDLATTILFNKDGHIRTEEELQAFKDSKDGKKIIEKFADAAGDPAIKDKGLEVLKTDPNFKNLYEKVADEAQKRVDAEGELKDVTETRDLYKSQVDAVKTFNDLKSKYDTAKTEYDNAQGEVNNIREQFSETTTGLFGKTKATDKKKPFVIDKDDNIKLSENFDLGSYIADDVAKAMEAVMNSEEYKNMTDDEGEEGKTADQKRQDLLDAKESELKTRYGLPSEFKLDSSVFVANTGNNSIEDIKNSIAKKINGDDATQGLDDEIKENIKQSILENKQSEFKSAKNKAEEKKAELDKNPDPSDPTNFKAAAEANGIDTKVEDAVKFYNNMDPDTRDSVATDIKEGKDKTQLQKCDEAVAKAEEHVNQIKNQRAANAEIVKNAQKNLASTGAAVALQDKVSKVVGLANDGEVVKTINGKKVQGFYSETEKDEHGKPKFIQRPTDEGSEEFKNYESELNKKLLTGNFERSSDEGVVIEKDGKYYLSTTGNVDDENNKEIDEDEAVLRLAEAEESNRNKKLQEHKKQEAITSFEDFIKNPSKKAADLKNNKIYRETIMMVLSDPQAVCKGVDAMGNETETKIVNSIKGLDIKTIEDLDLPDDIKDQLVDATKYYDDDEKEGMTGDSELYDEIENEKDSEDDDDSFDADDEDKGDENDDTETITTDNEDGTKTTSKKIINPKKVWKRRKNKTTGKPTKNYYHVNSTKDNPISISAKDFKEKVKNYKERLKKRKERQNKPANPPAGQTNGGGNPSSTTNTTQTPQTAESRYEDFKNYLFERFGS